MLEVRAVVRIGVGVKQCVACRVIVFCGAACMYAPGAPLHALAHPSILLLDRVGFGSGFRGVWTKHPHSLAT